MEDVKGALTSKTIWGALIAIVGVVLNAAGFESGTALSGAEGDIVTVIGSIIAIYGRVKAVKKIG